MTVGVGPLVLDQGPDPQSRSRRRRRPRPRPYEAGGPSWREDRLAAPRRLRRSAVFALVVHLLCAVVLLIAMRPRPRPPVRLEIPVQLVRIASPPPSLREKPRSQEVAVRVVREEKQKPKTPATPKPVPGRKDAQPVPVKTAKKSPAPPSTVGAARSDSSKVLRSEISLGGGALGVLEIGGGGELSVYSYYLMAVRDKIASYWNPPAGLSTKGGEIAATVAFRIDRRGNVTASYVEEPSGTGVFDSASLRAVGQANPLPPLPQDFPGEYVGIHLRFVYQD
jgi:periplasmic protein TonB